MRSPASPEEATSGAYATQLQRACSSSSGSITCTHDGNREDNGSDADNASSGKQDTKALDSQATAWTDSKHSSYLDFMEQNFVRDLYDREYCALDLCGQQAERHADSEDIHELDTAQSRFPDPFGSMENLLAKNSGSSEIRPQLY
ncbi:hypothetical protein KP509_09G046900 [Ceratopteris richardii]|uniref:Uncharacterized protein n=1 Tax=Ceratopteris richardii TaxID=49495 RepID=A0A8T2U752_CERRI|nr:hypothetical protein KP509_09G046900 [Ceratopteris richardii]